MHFSFQVRQNLKEGFYIIEEIDELMGLENLKERILQRLAAKLRIFINGYGLGRNDRVKSGDKIGVIDPESYPSRGFSQKEESYLVQGFYILTDFDRYVFSSNRELFWERFIRYSNLGRSVFVQTREAAGLSMDTLENLGDKRIFIPSERGLNSISVDYQNHEKLYPNPEKYLKSIMLFYNAKNNKNETNVTVTSTTRTPRRQAELIYENELRNNGKAAGSMYKGNSGKKVEELLKKGVLKEDIIRDITDGIENKKYTGFRHVENPGYTADIGKGSNSSFAENQEFKEVLTIFIKADKYLRGSNTLPLGRGGEKDAHHLVFYH